MDLKEVKKILQENDLYAKKQFGQNFLIDKNILSKIVHSANISDACTIIEVGPGMGALTELLVKDSKKVICYEIDTDMINILNKRFESVIDEKLYIYNVDFLKANLEEYQNESSVKLVANLPYYITTPILIKVLEEGSYIEEMIVMMQKEVAQRICGKPSTKDYNALSVLVQYKHKAELLFDVPKGCFYPEPEVTSSIVKISKKEPASVPSDEEFFYKFNRNIFKQRRKTLANNLKSSYNLSKEDIEEILVSNNYSVTVRSEALSIDDIIKLSDKFREKLSTKK